MADSFGYTFARIADVIERFTEEVGLNRYSLVMQDYGGPVGMRLAVRKPERLSALVVQNAVCHEDGASVRSGRPGVHSGPTVPVEVALRENFFTPNATRQRHVGNSPEPDRYDPDLWTDELAFLDQPGQPDIQTDLFYDYRTNMANYPVWHATTPPSR
jgi:pimeloyl-ACP methyl ester carboxylesterase